MDYQKAAKLTSCEDMTQLAEAINDIMLSPQTTVGDLLEALRIARADFIRESAALALYIKTGRSRTPPECNTDFWEWLRYILEHPECIPENDDEYGPSSWNSYLRRLKALGVIT